MASKIVGSAQRRRAGAVLQHGSLLLARSSRTPELPGVCDVADESAGNHDWSDRLLAANSPALGLRRVAVEVPDEVRARAMELQRDALPKPRMDRTDAVTLRVKRCGITVSRIRHDSTKSGSWISERLSYNGMRCDIAGVA